MLVLVVMTFAPFERLYIEFPTRAETKSTRVMFFIGDVRCRTYELPDGYRVMSRFRESAKSRRVGPGVE